MTVADIILEKLKALGAAGLCGDDCGCSLAEFPLCEYCNFDCVPAKAVSIKEHCKDKDCCNCLYGAHCDGYEDEARYGTTLYIPLEAKLP
jgi:hypothetical protein